MASCSTTKKGILFIYEEDGYEWTEYLKEELKKPAYSIPSNLVHWRCLTEDLTTSCSVHVLVLTPKMEQHVSEINYGLLNYSSLTSLILECNRDSRQLQMIEWAVRYRLEDNVENQRNLLTTIIQAYETAENDAEYDEIEVDVNVLPPMIFPGQEEIFIIFNSKQSWITVKMDGIKDRMRTRKYNDFIFGCQLSRETCGVKTIKVYKEDSSHPIYKTSITVVTVNALLQNLVDNLASSFGTSCNMENDDKNTQQRLALTSRMGIGFNPFLKASDELLMIFAKQVNNLYTLSSNDTNDDNGLKPEPTNTDSEIRRQKPTMQKSQSLPEERKGILIQDPIYENTSPLIDAELSSKNRNIQEVQTLPAKTKAPKKNIFSFGTKKSNAKKEKEKAKDKGINRRLSRRVERAMKEELKNMPKLPKH